MVLLAFCTEYIALSPIHSGSRTSCAIIKSIYFRNNNLFHAINMSTMYIAWQMWPYSFFFIQTSKDLILILRIQKEIRLTISYFSLFLFLSGQMFLRISIRHILVRWEGRRNKVSQQWNRKFCFLKTTTTTTTTPKDLEMNYWKAHWNQSATVK